MSIEPNDLRSTKLDIAVPPPAMDGEYNDELTPIGGAPVPYPICLKGVEFFFLLQAGQTYNATAALQGGFVDPDFRLQIFQGDDPNGPSRLFKQVVAGWPPSNYKSHTSVADNAYPLGQEVAVKVTVDASGANATITAL
jgi:hypothetical protein